MLMDQYWLFNLFQCVQYVDGSALAELVPRLVDLIKQSVGVSTKVGCSSFVVSLIHQCPMDLAPYASEFAKCKNSETSFFVLDFSYLLFFCTFCLNIYFFSECAVKSY